MRRNLIIAALTTFILVACPKNSNPLLDDAEQYCKPARLHLEQLGCISKDKPYTVKGKYFDEFCQDTMTNGIDLSPKCLSEITDCAQMNPCVQNKK